MRSVLVPFSPDVTKRQNMYKLKWVLIRWHGFKLLLPWGKTWFQEEEGNYKVIFHFLFYNLYNNTLTPLSIWVMVKGRNDSYIVVKMDIKKIKSAFLAS